MKEEAKGGRDCPRADDDQDDQDDQDDLDDQVEVLVPIPHSTVLGILS